MDKYITQEKFEMIFKDWDSQKDKELTDEKGKEHKKKWSPPKYYMNHQRGVGTIVVELPRQLYLP